jgi:hypothetical protein
LRRRPACSSGRGSDPRRRCRRHCTSAARLSRCTGLARAGRRALRLRRLVRRRPLRRRACCPAACWHPAMSPMRRWS